MSAQAPPRDARPRTRSQLSSEHSAEPAMSDAPAAAAPADATDTNTDSESELSESSEEPSDLSSSDEEDDGEDDDEADHAGEDSKSTQMELDEHQQQDEVVNLRANRGQKPTFKLSEDELGPDIRTFLKDFLPQLKAANEELEAQRKAGTLKKREIDAVDADEDKEYIEMNLGLGVLKMKDADADSSESESDGEDDDEDTPKEKDILGKLMGQERKKEAVTIQEVQDKPAS